MNSLFYLTLYRQKETWLFDDKKRGIIAEPFVSGASECITKHKKRIGNKKRKPEIVFSLSEIPNADIILTCTQKLFPEKDMRNVEVKDYTSEIKSYWNEMTEEKATSAWYKDQDGDDLWLCPAQLKFFGKVADKIYAKFI